MVDEILKSKERDVLLTALDVGYFDVPRRGTLVDLAEELQMSDSEVSEHLRRGVATVLRAHRDEVAGLSEGRPR